MTATSKTPVLCVVGPSGSGKTRLIEQLVFSLSRRGYRLGTAKHAAHGFVIDKPDTDSGRLSRSGAVMVALVSPGSAAVLYPDLEADDLESLDDILTHQTYPVDLVLAEGFSRSRFPKIVLTRARSGNRGPAPVKKREKKPPVFNVVLVLDTPSPESDVPVLPADNVEEIAQFIEERFLTGILEKRPNQPANVSLTVNGQAIPVNTFVSEVLSGAVLGMVASLKGCEGLKPGSRITIRISDE